MLFVTRLILQNRIEFYMVPNERQNFNVFHFGNHFEIVPLFCLVQFQKLIYHFRLLKTYFSAFLQNSDAIYFLWPSFVIFNLREGKLDHYYKKISWKIKAVCNFCNKSNNNKEKPFAVSKIYPCVSCTYTITSIVKSVTLLILTVGIILQNLPNHVEIKLVSCQQRRTIKVKVSFYCCISYRLNF